MKSKGLYSVMARQREYALSIDVSPSLDWIFSSTDDDDITLTSPGDDMWKKFGLITPPDSPQHELVDDCFESPTDCLSGSCEEDWLTTPICFEKNAAALSSNLIQDCMWSGSDGEKARTSRIRKVSLSELTMLTASTACVDPTSVSSTPRAQNQLEHSYSLTTPEPLRVPAIMTPASTDDSESEEDVIDVVTIDTRPQNVQTCASPSSPTVPAVHIPSNNSRIQSLYKVQHNLQAVANRLNREHKRPKCMSDHDFALPSKKVKKYHAHSMSSSMLSSQNSSDSEDFEGKRSAHNVMERQRRNDLKNSLLSLRACLPSLNTQERAPKVVILAHATDYVKDLRRQDIQLQNEVKGLRLKNTALKRKLEYIQSRIGLSSL